FLCPEEPGGRGPMATISFTYWKARLASTAGATTCVGVAGVGVTGLSSPAVALAAAAGLLCAQPLVSSRKMSQVAGVSLMLGSLPRALYGAWDGPAMPLRC